MNRLRNEAGVAFCIAIAGVAGLVTVSAQDAPSSATPDPRTTAREFLLEAAADYRDMMAQVGGISCSIQTGTDFTNIAGPDARSSTTAIRWDSEVMWDRATGNAVVGTRRTSHVTDGDEQVTSSRPTVFYSIDGVAMAHYSVLKSSIGELGTSAQQLDEDQDLIRDYLALTMLRGRRYDQHLRQLAEGALSKAQPGEVAVTVAPGTGTMRISIDHLNGAVRHYSESLAFRAWDFGWALEAFETELFAADGHTTEGTSTTITYAEVPIDGGMIVLPVGISNHVSQSIRDGDSFT